MDAAWCYSTYNIEVEYMLFLDLLINNININIIVLIALIFCAFASTPQDRAAWSGQVWGGIHLQAFIPNLKQFTLTAKIKTGVTIASHASRIQYSPRDKFRIKVLIPEVHWNVYFFIECYHLHLIFVVLFKIEKKKKHAICPILIFFNSPIE